MQCLFILLILVYHDQATGYNPSILFWNIYYTAVWLSISWLKLIILFGDRNTSLSTTRFSFLNVILNFQLNYCELIISFCHCYFCFTMIIVFG